jgi:hypothetical protein
VYVDTGTAVTAIFHECRTIPAKPSRAQELARGGLTVLGRSVQQHLHRPGPRPGRAYLGLRTIDDL